MNMSVPDNSQRRVSNASSARFTPKIKIITFTAFSALLAFGGSKMYGQNEAKTLAAVGSKVGETTIVDSKKELGYPPYFDKSGSFPKEYSEGKRSWGYEKGEGNTVKIKYFKGYSASDGKKETSEAVAAPVVSIKPLFHTEDAYIDDKTIDVVQLTLANGQKTIKISVFDNTTNSAHSFTADTTGTVLGTIYWMGSVYVLTNKNELVTVNILKRTSKTRSLQKELAEKGVDLSTTNNATFGIYPSGEKFLLAIGAGGKGIYLEVETPPPVFSMR